MTVVGLFGDGLGGEEVGWALAGGGRKTVPAGASRDIGFAAGGEELRKGDEAGTSTTLRGGGEDEAARDRAGLERICVGCVLPRAADGEQGMVSPP